jgi:hypothetical protein
MTRPTIIARVALVVAALPAVALAQTEAPRGRALAPVSGWIGAGFAAPLAQPGVDRRVGGTGFVALESGLANYPVRLRLEGGLSSNVLRRSPGGVISGDVQMGYAALAARVSPVGVLRGGVSPYLLAGPLVARPSTRIEVENTRVNTPGGSFSQTSSVVKAGALAGVGTSIQLSRSSVFAEVRWLTVATDDRRTTSMPIVIGATLPLTR